MELVKQPPLDVLGHLKGLVLDSVHSRHSKRNYGRALDHYFAWIVRVGGREFTKGTVQEYRAFLETLGWSAATCNLTITAVRRLAAEAADAGYLKLEVAGAIARVKSIKRLGVRSGNWLTKEQVQMLLAAPNLGTLLGMRDRAILAVLTGCGIRRDECARLKLSDIQQRDGRWVIVDMIGKGGRVRTVPMPAWVKVCVDEWRLRLETTKLQIDARNAGERPEENGLSDTSSQNDNQGGRAAICAFISITKGAGTVGETLTPEAILQLVKRYSFVSLGFAIAPHDLRRTCAKLCRSSGGDLEQIQLLLGHASIQTTEKYLGIKQNLVDAPNDRMGITI